MTLARGAAASRVRAALPWLVLALGLGCTRELTLGSDEQPGSSAGMAGALSAGGRAGGAGQGGTSGTGTGGNAGANDAGAAGETPCVRVACSGTVYKCGN